MFSRGRDGGIDLRYLHPTDGSLVVQCKHLLQSGWPTLKSQLKNTELAKVEALSPQRCVVVTSVPMNPHRKEQIFAIFSGFMESQADVNRQRNPGRLVRRPSGYRFAPSIPRA